MKTRCMRLKRKLCLWLPSLGVATTGIAGPDGGTGERPVGTVFVAVAGASGVDVDELHIGGERDRVRLWATQRALNMLRRRLESGTVS